jgi:hypothetical protein
MLLELIARYYKYLWVAFGVIAFIKVILSYFFQGSLENLNAVIYSLFKWHGSDEMEMEEVNNRRTMMGIQNVVLILMYITLIVILVATLLLYFFR